VYYYLTEAMLENEHTMNPTKRFSGRISDRAETLNATMQLITACRTPNFKSAAVVTKGCRCGRLGFLLFCWAWRRGCFRGLVDGIAATLIV
jgi:hypothetical protein